MKSISANKFAPQGLNPKELKEKVKEVMTHWFTLFDYNV
jgi:hypothetical protein